MVEGELLIEKRKFPRWHCTLDVKYKIIKDEKLSKFKDIFQKTKDIRTSDISGGGALLISNEPLKIGEKISMNIFLPSSDSYIKMFAEVVRVFDRKENGEDKYYAGVKYIEVKTESDDILGEIIEQKMAASRKGDLTKEEALKMAQHEYFLRLLHEELRDKKLK